MRVAFVVPSLGIREGQGGANLELLRRVAAAGHAVEVFTSSAPPAAADLLGVRIHLVPRLPAWQLGNHLIQLGATGALVRRHRVDLVHADAGVTLRRADVVVVHTVSDRWLQLPHDVWREPGLRGRHNDAATRFKARLEIAHARRARAVVANSRMTAHDLIARGVEPARVHVLPFGVDAGRFRPPTPEERASARSSFGLDDGTFVWAFVGALGPRKGIPLALDALSAGDGTEHLVVAGDLRGGRWTGEIRARGLPVSMPGKLGDVRRAYWAADVLVYPSRYDAFGMAVLEAMACGLPVLVSTEAGVHEIVTDAGYVLPPTDVPAWRAALDRLRADTDRRAAMGARARAIAERHDWDEAGAKLLELYERLPA